MQDNQEQVQETQVEEQQAQTQSLIMDNDEAFQSTQPEAEEGQEEPVEQSPAPVQDEGTKPAIQQQPAQQEVRQEKPLEDPGEFKPNDYSFEVELADGTKIPINSPEDFKNIPQDADFGTPKNFMDVQAKYVRMVNGIESDRKVFEESKTAYEQQQEAAQQQEQYLQTMMSEFAYLEANGELPPVPAQYENADWSDPEVAKQPGVKERLDLLQFRSEENTKRAQVGLPRIGVLEARTMLENKALKEAQVQRTQRENDMRKKRGAMVSGQSAPAPSSAASGDMIVGSGGSLRDL